MKSVLLITHREGQGIVLNFQTELMVYQLSLELKSMESTKLNYSHKLKPWALVWDSILWYSRAMHSYCPTPLNRHSQGRQSWGWGVTTPRFWPGRSWGSRWSQGVMGGSRKIISDENTSQSSVVFQFLCQWLKISSENLPWKTEKSWTTNEYLICFWNFSSPGISTPNFNPDWRRGNSIVVLI